MGAYQRIIVGKIIISGVKTKVRIGDGGTRHVDAVDNLLEEGGGVIVRSKVVNGESGMGEKEKQKCTAYLTKGTNQSHDQGKNNQKPIKE